MGKLQDKIKSYYATGCNLKRGEENFAASTRI
jgi:hypothetical protein